MAAPGASKKLGDTWNEAHVRLSIGQGGAQLARWFYIGQALHLPVCIALAFIHCPGACGTCLAQLGPRNMFCSHSPT